MTSRESEFSGPLGLLLSSHLTRERIPCPLRSQVPWALPPDHPPDPCCLPLGPCSPQYLLDSNSWIEEMPSERLCQSTRQRAACAQLRSFVQEYGMQGCQV